MHRDRQSQPNDLNMGYHYIRVNPDGDVIYSQMIEMKVNSPMKLDYFPYHVVTLNIIFESYGYFSKDLVFKIHDDKDPLKSLHTLKETVNKSDFLLGKVLLNSLMSSNIKRKLAAIMFTDIAGYTALSSLDENKALKLLDKQEEILTPIIEEFNGTLHNRIGDGLLFTFPTVTDAIKCGIKIQKGTKEVEDLNLRIGIHEGEITIKNGDVLGDDVNVASRIDPFAAEGGIVISGKVQQNISSLPEFKTKFISEPLLKGVNQDVKVYCIVSHGLPETDITKVTAKLEKDVKKLWFNQKSIMATIGVLGILIVGIVLWINKNNSQIDNSQIDNSQDVHLIYIGSLEENINIAEWRAENLLSENEGAKVSLIDESELKNIRIDLESELYSEFFHQNLIIQMLKNDEEIGYVNNSIKEHGEPEALAGSIYKFFDRPKHIIFVRVYAIKSHEGEIMKYAFDALSLYAVVQTRSIIYTGFTVV